MKTDTRIRYVGLDVHQDSISVAIAEDGPQGEVRHFGSITADLHRLDQLLCKLRKDGATLKFAYEAGPGGFVICRRLRKLGIDCLVAAPSLIPLKAGDRVKTDRRDAIKLARLLRMGELTGVHVPEPDDEAIRDVCRSRCDAVCAARRCRQQLSALLLRHGYRVPRVPWSEGHVRHLRETALAHPALKIALEEYIQAVEAAKDRVARLETHMQALLESWGMRPFVEALMALRGVDWITAMVLVAELGDIRRFTRPKQLMSYLGLVASERSSGQSRHQGGITKAGNTHARWMLVESAWHCRRPPRIGKNLSRRQHGLSREIKVLAWKAQNRLYHKFRLLTARGLHRNKVVIAVARELCGFVWAVLHQVYVPAGQKVIAPPVVAAETPKNPARTYTLRRTVAQRGLLKRSGAPPPRPRSLAHETGTSRHPVTHATLQPKGRPQGSRGDSSLASGRSGCSPAEPCPVRTQKRNKPGKDSRQERRQSGRRGGTPKPARP